MDIKPIETIYNGYRFRSRLEARWAVFFDTLDIRYEYEIEGYVLNGIHYLPDFWVPSWHSWVEIKPEYPSPKEKKKGLNLWMATKKRCLIIWGSPYAYIPYDPLEKARIDYRLNLADKHFLDRHTKQWSDRNESIEIFSECPVCHGINLARILDDGYCHGGIGLGCQCDEPVLSSDYGRERTEFINPRLIAAYTAARQARFEHGERGV